jgi:Protein kinase domain
LADDPKTVDGRGRKGSAPRTIKMPSDAESGVPPVMPTVHGDAAAVSTAGPPEMPPPRYQLGTEIARGGMGRVVEATDTLLGRAVAIKEALATEPEALRRFARETRITARLEHPSIVPVHDAGATANGSPYYVMRKVSGRPLERLVSIADTLDKRLALLPHVVAAAQAVAHAHSRGIVHRDIKPSNILIGDFGETILIDWGLAKVIGEPDEPAPRAEPDPGESLRTKAGVVYGTPGFMSPEQLRGGNVDERCDVYALGATLYHLLSRKPPHHAKTAEEMMKAAMAGPPPPLAELVPGVPPELSTIVDKALAQDPQTRYPNATSLAEDLVRFLTGQLVGSHRYSPRERLARFVRQNRVPVTVAMSAGVLLGIVGIVAVRRVVNERDRADEQAKIALDQKRVAEEARNDAEKHADDLTIAHAWTEVETHPTETVVDLKPLATKRWREVRAIAAAARASGVAFELQASAKTASVEIARDGAHALAGGDDGVVRLHDLAHRTTRELARLGGPVRARFADDDRRVLAASGNDLVIIDAANGVKRGVHTPTPVADLAAVGAIAYWVDGANALWQLDLAKSDAVKLPVDEPVRSLKPSPDGRWIALAGDSHLLLLDRTQSGPPIVIADGDTRHMGWSADGGHLAALIDEQAIDVEMAPSPTVIHKLTVGRRFQIAYDNGHTYTVGPTGIGILPPVAVAHKPVTGTPIGLRVARGNTIVAGGNQGLITVLSDDGDEVLRAPSSRILSIEASPRSPYIIAIVDDARLLVWNLDDIQPRRVTTAQPAGAGFIGADQVLASFGAEAPAQWIDLRTGHAVAVGTAPALLATAAAPNGRTAIAIDLTHHARIVAPGREPADIAGPVDFARFVDDERAVIASADGKVELLEVATGHRMVLVARKVSLLGMTASRTTIAAAFADGTLWRHEVATGVDGQLAATPKPTGPILVLSDGIAYAADHELRIWRGDHTLLVPAGFQHPIDKLALADGSIVAVTTDGGAHVITTTIPPGITSALAGPGASVSSETGLIVVLSREGTIEVVDPLVKQRWPLAVAGVVPFIYPQISPDGRHVFALTRRGLLVWTLDLPGPDDTRKWLDTMTNASGSR